MFYGGFRYLMHGAQTSAFFSQLYVCHLRWVAESVLEYTYLLFWNSFWTIAPVIGMGLFDRIIGKIFIALSLSCFWCFSLIDDDVLMKIPELYRFGREGKLFGIRLFVIYMVDGIYQVSECYKSSNAQVLMQNGQPVGRCLLFNCVHLHDDNNSSRWFCSSAVRICYGKLLVFLRSSCRWLFRIRQWLSLRYGWPICSTVWTPVSGRGGCSSRYSWE